MHIPWHLLHNSSSRQIRAFTSATLYQTPRSNLKRTGVLSHNRAFSNIPQRKKEMEEKNDDIESKIEPKSTESGKTDHVASALKNVLPPDDTEPSPYSTTSYDTRQGPLGGEPDEVEVAKTERPRLLIRKHPSLATAPKPARLTHLNAAGEAHMVDVGSKQATKRTAIATGTVVFSNSQTYPLLEPDKNKKGDVFATARIAGIQAAKMTAQLIPLCHPIALTSVTVVLRPIAPAPDAGSHAFRRWAKMPFGGVKVAAKVECVGQTGVEMEALTAVNVAALTIVDMCKAVDKGMAIERCRVVLKTGGKSGTWRHSGMSDPEVENM